MVEAAGFVQLCKDPTYRSPGGEGLNSTSYIAMGETEKPFACDVPGCSVRFVSEDRLTSHKKRHRVAALSLNVGSSVGSKNVVEQTPTPTRFIDYIEESGLFQELQPELSTPELHNNVQHLNPFEADFRRASHGELIVPEALSSINATDDSLNTPCIPPVTADPIALRGMPTPFTALIRDVIDTPNLLKVAKSVSATTISVAQQASAKGQCPGDKKSQQKSEDDNQKDDASPPAVEAAVTIASEKEKTVDSIAPAAKLECAKTSVLRACPKSPKPISVLMKPVQGPAGPASGAVLAVPSSAPPTVASPFSLPVSLPPRVPSAPLQPVAVAPVPVAAPVTGVPPKTTIIASHTGSLIQVSDGIQFLIVSNPPGTGRAAVQVPCVAPPIVQQHTKTNCTCWFYRSKRRQENGIDDERKKKNRENNRYAAQRSRQKKKKLSEITRKERDEYKRKFEELQAKYRECLVSACPTGYGSRDDSARIEEPAVPIAADGRRVSMASDVNSESSGSDSGSTPEEERIRRLFQTCDGNGDGYIDG
ncbi:cyclic-AMP-dependent transcription factor atf2, putative [Ixodes scapularis]|uniref:Cyclic-AMP-dependent transcription factor atf2, putative n=2 Tax=Ixodes scapularis TaxID=6945 RepID=B7Q0E2_IXOSC|nr:cyclic-AMP-dependent transcription factor atf2, putative [Ixodes scapularis]|eukprot:XP_002407471.1 cyclic-AMP-dependent transcription factor atf2, putative [Ixodes scapularis]